MRRPNHATIVAYLALFVALGGSSYAAIRITGKNVKNSSLTGKDVKNSSLTSSDVKNRSLLSKDFKKGQLPRGPQGLPGAPGNDFSASSTLKSGEVLSGPFGAASSGSGSGNFLVDAIEFSPRLPADLCVDGSCAEYRPSGTTSTACPGRGQAAPGKLCFYETTSDGGPTFACACDPETFNGEAVRSYGTILYLNGSTTPRSTRGTWTVRVP
jgi:hypothetical protein